MGKEQRIAGFQRSDAPHIGIVQHEIEYIEVLRHALLAHGLGNDNYIGLHEIAQSHLRGSLVVLLGDFDQRLVGEHAVFSFCEQCPCHVLRTILDQIIMRRPLLVEHMRFDLVHSRLHFNETGKIDIAVGIEIAHADGAQFAGFISLLHRAIGAVVVAEGLMDEHEVDVIGLKFAQGYSIYKEDLPYETF